MVLLWKHKSIWKFWAISHTNFWNGSLLTYKIGTHLVPLYFMESHHSQPSMMHLLLHTDAIFPLTTPHFCLFSLLFLAAFSFASFLAALAYREFTFWIALPSAQVNVHFICGVMSRTKTTSSHFIPFKTNFLLTKWLDHANQIMQLEHNSNHQKGLLLRQSIGYPSKQP